MAAQQPKQLRKTRATRLHFVIAGTERTVCDRDAREPLIEWTGNLYEFDKSERACGNCKRGLA